MFHLSIIPIILAIWHEITQNFANFSLTIMKNSENYHSRISRFTQIVKREITFILFSLKFSSQSITILLIHKRMHHFDQELYGGKIKYFAFWLEINLFLINKDLYKNIIELSFYNELLIFLPLFVFLFSHSAMEIAKSPTILKYGFKISSMIASLSL